MYLAALCSYFHKWLEKLIILSLISLLSRGVILKCWLVGLPLFLPQHQFVTQDDHGDILYQLVQRTKEAVRLLDHQNYRRLQKLLMGRESTETENATVDDEIESEPPRSVVYVCV